MMNTNGKIKEYMAQASYDGIDWHPARLISGMPSGVFDTIGGAKDFIDLCIRGWEDFAKENEVYARQAKEHPVLYRVVSRVVTGWSAE